jgi:hypothetical protein
MVDEFESLLDRLQIPESYFEEMRITVKRELAQAGKRAVEMERVKTEARVKLKREQEKLLDYLMRGTIDDETYDARLKKLRSEVVELDREVTTNDLEFQDIDATLKYARRVLLEPRTFWAKSNNELKIQLQSLWCPEGILFDKSKPVRTRLTTNTPALYKENAGAVKSWYGKRTQAKKQDLLSGSPESHKSTIDRILTVKSFGYLLAGKRLSAKSEPQRAWFAIRGRSVLPSAIHLIFGVHVVRYIGALKEAIMSYMQVKDLKKSRELWLRLEQDRELVITCDGQPRAIMIGIDPGELEAALPEIRRALFSTAVGRVRERATSLPNAEDDIALAILESRKERL